MAVPEVSFGVAPKLKLPALLGGRRVNPCRSQPLYMVNAFIWINDVNRLIATLEPGFDKRKQYAIRFIVAIEERTEMTCFAELGAGKRNRCHGLLHGSFLPFASLSPRPLYSRRP